MLSRKLRFKEIISNPELKVGQDETSLVVDEGYMSPKSYWEEREESKNRSQEESPGFWESSRGFARQPTNGVPTVAGGHQAGQAGQGWH